MCDFILTRGARKNDVCGRKICDEETKKCRSHAVATKTGEKHCMFILTRGQRKGSECGKKIKTDEFCYAHSKTVEFVRCNVIISRGARKGMTCDRRCNRTETRCSTHQKKDISKKTKEVNHTPAQIEVQKNPTEQTKFILPEIWLTNEIPDFDLDRGIIESKEELEITVNCPGDLKNAIKGRRNITEEGASIEFKNGKFYYKSLSGQITLGEIAFAFYYIYWKCHAKRSVVKVSEFVYDPATNTITDNGIAHTKEDNKKI